MMKFCTFLFVIYSSTISFAQTGNYFLSHFSPDEERFNITCFDIAQDDRGVFYFATQAGILQFDGRNWDIIATEGTIYSVARSASREIYVAGSQGFGKISVDKHGMEIYQPLYKQQHGEYFFQIITFPDRVYFLSERDLFEYSLTSGEMKTQRASDLTGSFVALHEIFGKLYVSSETKGLFEVTTNQVAPADFFGLDKAIIFSLKFNNRYLLGTDDSRVFIHGENNSLREIKFQDSVYIKTSVITNATWVNDNLIALGTLRGGVVFINPTTGSTEEIINYNTGLPDNEVYAVICDKNQNVWVAHAYGFTRVAPFLPFRSFRYYPGLKGNLLCATTYNNSVYVGTSVGLFKLEKEEFYDEITYFVDVPIRTKTNQSAKGVVEDKKEEVKKGGVFSFLKRKKKEQGVDATATQNQKAPTQSTVTFKREKRTKRILRAAHYAYKRVEGIDSKITQLIHWNDKFVVVGLGGAYEITPLGVTNIIEEPIRFLFGSKQTNKIIASTYSDKLHQYKFEDSRWKQEDLMVKINGPVNYIFEEDSSAIWFCGFDKIFRMSLTDTVQNLQTLTINKQNFDQPLGICFDKKVFIATSLGFYFYDPEKKILVEGDTLRKPVAYFASATDMWFRDKHSWYVAGKSGGHNNLQLLNLFSNIRFIDTDVEQQALWVITGNNELLQFNSEAARSEDVLFPLILKSILNNSVLVPRKNKVSIDQESSSIRVEVIRPDFIGARLIEYRYLLDGINVKWSDWSNNNNIIQFPYLPVGTYKLLVQSKDIFGRLSELDPISIEVLPPYWKRTWFYALEFALFTFLVFLSFKLSSRFSLISRLLSLLSIIILIEFIQTAAGSTFTTSGGPVVDFLIQVCVAFVILPVEGFLRKFMLKSIEKKAIARTGNE